MFNMMKKFTTILLASSLALGLAACNKNQGRDIVPEDGTTTSGAVVAQLVRGGNGLNALTDGQQDVAGQGGEDKVKDGYLFFAAAPGKALTMSQDGSNTTIFKSQIFQTAPDPAAKVALLLNKNVDLTLSDFTKNKTIKLDDLANFIKADGFMMTSTVEDATKNTIDIKKDKDDTAVNGGENNFTFDVERVVAKLQVAKAATPTVAQELVDKGTVSMDLKYALAGSAKEAYLFRDNAGDRQLDAATAGKHIYKGFKSFIDTEANPTLQKVSDGSANNYFKTAKAMNEVGATKASTADGFFFLENSMYGGTNVATAKGAILFNRIAYAKVYTTFAPKAGKKVNATNLDKLSYTSAELTDAVAADFNKVREYEVVVPQDWYTARKDKAEYAGKFTEVPEVPADQAAGTPGHAAYVKFKVKDEAGTFYVGADGIIYDTQLAAAAAGNTTYRKFDGGKMVYLTPANAQKAATGDLINYCDTRRNNIYDLTIAGFADLGHNYDPVDPEDPNIPQPGDNPGEPEPDPNIPVQNEVTKMLVKAQILQWNLVNRDVTLGK